ncbi:MAG TPA: hypothetical protein VIK18_19785 [Pirellulales bacterium]
MRTILSLSLALVIGGGIATLTGCDKGKTGTTHEDKTKVTTPGGGEKETKTKTETTETPPKDDK